MSSTMLHNDLALGRAGKARKAVRRDSLFVRLLVLWFGLRAKQRSRQHLAELDPRLLRDIGLDRASASVEARRRIWQ